MTASESSKCIFPQYHFNTRTVINQSVLYSASTRSRERTVGTDRVRQLIVSGVEHSRTDLNALSDHQGAVESVLYCRLLSVLIGGLLLKW